MSGYKLAMIINKESNVFADDKHVSIELDQRDIDELSQELGSKSNRRVIVVLVHWDENNKRLTVYKDTITGVLKCTLPTRIGDRVSCEDYITIHNRTKIDECLSNHNKSFEDLLNITQSKFNMRIDDICVSVGSEIVYQ